MTDHTSFRNLTPAEREAFKSAFLAVYGPEFKEIFDQPQWHDVADLLMDWSEFLRPHVNLEKHPCLPGILAIAQINGDLPGSTMAQLQEAQAIQILSVYDDLRAALSPSQTGDPDKTLATIASGVDIALRGRTRRR